MQAPKICLGTIVGPCGLKGAVKVKTFGTPLALQHYGVLSNKEGTRFFEIVDIQEKKTNLALVAFKGITTRTEGESLRNISLYVEREKLPPLPAEEFYLADLITLMVETTTGTVYGKVITLHDFGGGPFLEILTQEKGKKVLLPFTKKTVPTVDLINQKLIADDESLSRWENLVKDKPNSKNVVC